VTISFSRRVTFQFFFLEEYEIKLSSYLLVSKTVTTHFSLRNTCILELLGININMEVTITEHNFCATL
jgi:hypothetical protein